MKKSLIVLLIMVLACSFAFAADDYKHAYRNYAEELTDSVELSGKLSATYDYDFLTMTGSFAKKAKLAYFDLNATKVFSTGAGSAKGEGAIYAAVNAELTFSYDFSAAVTTGDPWDGSSSLFGADTWKAYDFLTIGGSDSPITMKLAITDAYIAKDGAWKLNLMKSDVGLDYAKSALSTMNEYYVYGDYKLEDTKKVALSMANPVKKHTGVILTTEGNPYLAEISFGMSGKDNVETNDTATTKGLFNFLIKSQEVAVDNVTLSAGAVIGTAETYKTKFVDKNNVVATGKESAEAALDKGTDGKYTVGESFVVDDLDADGKKQLTKSTLNFAAGLKIAYADDVVTADAAADFAIADLEDEKNFDADVAFNFAAAGVKFNFYYATKATFSADTDYVLYDGLGTDLKPYFDTTYVAKKDALGKYYRVAASTATTKEKYAEAKLAYAFNYADVDFELGVKGTNLNWANRKFSFVGTAANDVFTFGAEIGYVPGETAVTVVKATKQVTGDFDLTYTADLFNVAADFEFSHLLDEVDAEKATQWGLALKIQSDKIVDGANFGLKYTRATADLTDIVDVAGGVSKITAFAEIAF